MSSMLGIDSYTQGKATKEAAKISAKAAKYAANLQYQMWETTRKDLMPWMTAGQEAVGELWGKVKAGPGEYEKSPYYDFLQEEGVNALERGAAARGKLFSGGEAKALTKYGQQLASTDYDAWLNRWYQSLTPYQSLAQLGQTTGSQIGQLGAVAAGQAGGAIERAGQYGAAGMLGLGNTIANQLSYSTNPQNIMNTINQVKQGVNALSGLFGGGGITDVPVSGLTGAQMNSMIWL